MRLLAVLLSLTHLLIVSHALPGVTNSSHPPLFSPTSSSSSLPTLHTTLSSLLPILPHLSPPPEHTLLVTLATPAFKPLLYNWLCFLRYKAKWGQPATHDIHGQRTREKSEEQRTGWEDTPKVLVVTSDETLAKELAQEGVVTWWLKAADLDAVPDNDDDEGGEGADEDALAKLDRQLQDDLFTNLRLLDLLLPSQPDEDLAERLTDQLIPWGTLHYQSLMLERTLAMSALVGALVESQKSDPRFRREEDAAWRRKLFEHDWESDEPLEMPEWVGVKGVLLVDNDAVWLSSPSPLIAHYYRPYASHPSIVYATDMAPTTQNAWGTTAMPCACFFYSRVSDKGAHLASPPSYSPYAAASATRLPPPEERDPYLHSPSEGAAEVWRSTALCHITMLLDAVDAGKKQALLRQMHAVGERAGLSASKSDQLTLNKPSRDGANHAAPPPATPDTIASLKKATAPSFQATALGPALFLAEQGEAHLPSLSHAQWLAALGSGDVDDLLDVLDESGLSYVPSIGFASSSSSKGAKKRTCLSLAQAHQRFTPAPPPPLTTLELLASYAAPATPYSPPPTRPHRPVRSEPLPYDLFPPGMRFFDGGLEPGARPCVVHANYAMGKKKEELLRERGLWALVPSSEEGGQWTCSAEVMARA
ncbi:hypothetical protein JCM6882_000361 [Rhodosporidiobolus microsporus]